MNSIIIDRDQYLELEKIGIGAFVPLTGFMNEKSQVNPSHSYSISNQIAENYVLAASDDKNLNCTIFRLSNAVGRPLNKGTNCWSLVTNDLCKSVICNRKIQYNYLNPSGNQISSPPCG